MMLQAAEIAKAARDGRIKLHEEELQQLFSAARAIMEMIDALPEEDLQDIPATSYGHGQPGRLREDVQEPSLPREEVLSNAADADAYCFHVPRIVEE